MSNSDSDKKAKKLGASVNESIKDNSNYLRGDLINSLHNEYIGSVSDDDAQLTKFHGTYLQDDRDLRAGRMKKMLDKAYSFMIRVRVAGGVCSPEQWLHMDYIADNLANGTIKLTTRQAFQFHGVIKNNLRLTMQEINKALLDTIAACGDVNRNVMSAANPYETKHHAAAHKLAQDISDHLTPQTGAYHEIWLDDELYQKVGLERGLSEDEQNSLATLSDKKDTNATEEEPIYGKHYLPRKFKTVVAVPPVNDVDIFAHCLGFIAVVENDELIGYNVTIGGGMGMTHGDTDTFPRTADVMAFCTPEQAVDVAEKIVTVQRDWGNRDVRKRARMKYTVEVYGVDKIRAEVEKRLGYKLEDAKSFKFNKRGDIYGWHKGDDGKHHLGLYISNGRVLDTKTLKMKECLREVAKIHKGKFILTNNQNLIIASVAGEDKPAIDKLIKDYGLDMYDSSTGLRLNSMACVSLPTCGLALAESERYLPDLITEIDDIITANGLEQDEIVIRMTGCPNGCARPYLAEIGFVGKGPEKYNLYLGAAFDGTRLNKLYKEDVQASEIKEVLSPIIADYAKNRQVGEHFGDFTVRAGYVKATNAGNEFHKNIAL